MHRARMRNAFGTFGDVTDCSEGIALAKHAEDSVTIVARSRPCPVHLVVNFGCREAAPQFLWQHFLARPSTAWLGLSRHDCSLSVADSLDLGPPIEPAD